MGDQKEPRELEPVPLRQRVREALESKLLSAVRPGSLVRRGTGQSCFICTLRITPSEVECVVQEVDGQDHRSVTVHEPCLLLWRVESVAKAQKELGL